jgi:hypothetical protein
MTLVMNATLVLEAIVTPPSIWFVLIPAVRGLSLLTIQTTWVYGLLEIVQKGTNKETVSEISSHLQFPTTLRSDLTEVLCDKWAFSSPCFAHFVHMASYHRYGITLMSVFS